MLDRHVELIEEAAAKGAQVVCMQEIFYGPYFPAEQDERWYDLTEPIPDGETTRLMQELARKHQMVIVVPIYEEEGTGLYYNTAAVIDADGTYLGKYRKTHIPHCNPGFWEKFYFRPGNSGFPVLDTAVSERLRSGSYGMGPSSSTPWSQRNRRPSGYSTRRPTGAPSPSPQTSPVMAPASSRANRTVA